MSSTIERLERRLRTWQRELADGGKLAEFAPQAIRELEEDIVRERGRIRANIARRDAEERAKR